MENVFSIGNKNVCPSPGEFVLMDTSVVLELTGYNQETNRTREVKDFLIKLAYNDNIITTSVKTWEEVNLIFNREISKNKSNQYNNNNAFVKVRQEVGKIKKVIGDLPNVYSEPIGVIDHKTIELAQNNSIKYNLKWGDSVIVTIAEREEVSNLWSLDSDFSRVNNGTSIYLDSKSYNKALKHSNKDNLFNNT